MQCPDWDKEAAGEPSDSCNDGRETESFGREGTDQGDKESYPGLVEGHVGENNLKVDEKLVRLSIHQLWEGEGGRVHVSVMWCVCVSACMYM